MLPHLQVHASNSAGYSTVGASQFMRAPDAFTQQIRTDAGVVEDGDNWHQLGAADYFEATVDDDIHELDFQEDIAMQSHGPDEVEGLGSARAHEHHQENLVSVYAAESEDEDMVFENFWRPNRLY